MRIQATLNENFIANIDYEVDYDEVSGLKISCPVTGMDLTDLVAYSSTAWDQAWRAAERHMLSLPVSKQSKCDMRSDMRSMTYDTPFRN